ncbi:MAG: hypothetical protein PHO07_20115 [Pirellulales bacterium]|jgi:hypothetical protein|nr:hypothetical protein [Thermoguttaceae bacterium]MDD4789482.1 hypothetical protein [Pirellulales bacterium]MDI9445807.1 hypothetical protein [Planctomycetota bacterium]NLZ03169.1 hypothetical protein [Pirellulaceae bacterium]
MTESELIIRLEDAQQGQQTAGDGGVYSIDEVIRELMAHYQPLAAASESPVLHPVAC